MLEHPAHMLDDVTIENSDSRDQVENKQNKQNNAVMITNSEESSKCQSESEESKAKTIADVNKRPLPIINDSPSQISPPKKKLKQEPLPFCKVSKDEVIEKQSREVLVERQAFKYCTQKSGDCNNAESPENAEKKILKEVSLSAKKCSPISKEEKQKLKEQKEQQKQQRLKEIEERKKKKEDERLKKELERVKREEEKLKKEKERQADKERKELEKKEKERIREEEKRKKEEERKKKEEEKEAERERKEIERKQKEAEREKKEAEKKLEEEKKKQEEEAARRKQQRISSNFKSFFTKRQTKEKQMKSVEDLLFHPFQLKPGMVLAPLRRRSNFNKETLDSFFKQETPANIENILDTLKQKHLTKNYVTRRSIRKVEREKKKEKNILSDSESKCRKAIICISDDEQDDDDVDLEVSQSNLYHAKLLQFSENTRPAFYGTWRKSTNKINGRRILGLDNDTFNYEIDSDEEWIDEPGEDLSDENADEGEDKDEEETEDDHDGFFVPHGYLSDDEGIPDSDNEDGDKDNESSFKNVNRDLAADREKEKLNAKLGSLEAEFLKNKVKARKPICIGVVFSNKLADIHPLLQSYKAVKLLPSQDDKVEDDETESKKMNRSMESLSNSTMKNDNENYNSIPLTIPEEAMPLFIKFLHGNLNGIDKLSETFRDYWPKYVKKKNLSVRTVISKTQFRLKVQKIASKSYSNELQKICYIVNKDILEKYELTGQSLGEGLPNIDNFDTDNNEHLQFELTNQDSEIFRNHSANSSFTKLNGVEMLVE